MNCPAHLRQMKTEEAGKELLAIHQCCPSDLADYGIE